MPQVLDQKRFSRADRAFTTRRVPTSAMQVLLDSGDLDGYCFRPGDLALARVDRIGHHQRLERANGRRARLFTGDEIILALGPRYAPDQYEAFTPTTLGPCHLAAAGGIAGQIMTIHDRIIRPTEITLLNLIGSGKKQPLNLADFAINKQRNIATMPTIIVVGTSMNAGKTTSAAALIHGLNAAGLRVGAAKITGTGAGGDFWHYQDAGAAHVVDFVDAGHAATYMVTPDELERTTVALLAELQDAACDISVVEIADGLNQQETCALLSRPLLRKLSPKVIFSAREASGALHGVSWLTAGGFDVACVSGLLTRSPLAMREFTEAESRTLCMTFDQLCKPEIARSLVGQFRGQLEIAS